MRVVIGASELLRGFALLLLFTAPALAWTQNDWFLPELTMQAAQDRSAQAARDLGTDGAQTKYWWEVTPMNYGDNQAAVVIRPSPGPEPNEEHFDNEHTLTGAPDMHHALTDAETNALLPYSAVWDKLPCTPNLSPPPAEICPPPPTQAQWKQGDYLKARPQ